MATNYNTRGVIITKYKEHIAIINIIISIILIIYTFIQIARWEEKKDIDKKYDIIFTSLGLGVNVILTLYTWYNQDAYNITPILEKIK